MTTAQKIKYTEEERAEIVRMHMDTHDGKVTSEEFLQEARDPSHPAHDYFLWDDSAAGHQHRLWQVRHFVKFTVKREDMSVLPSTGYSTTVKTAPALVNPIANRNDDTERGYISTNSSEGILASRHEIGTIILNLINNRAAVLTDKEIKGIEKSVQPLKSNAIPKGL